MATKPPGALMRFYALTLAITLLLAWASPYVLFAQVELPEAIGLAVGGALSELFRIARGGTTTQGGTDTA